MLGLDVLLISGLIYVARRTYEYIAEEPQKQPSANPPASPTTNKDVADVVAEELAEAERARTGHALAVTALGLTVAGALAVPGATVLGVGCVLYNTIDSLRVAGRKWRDDGRLGAELIDVPAVWISIGVGLYVVGAFADWVYFTSARLRVAARGRLRDNLEGVFGAAPVMVWQLVDEVEVAVPLDRVRADDTVVVGAGELVPVDGVVVRGEAAVDQRFLTGEAQPAEKSPGDEVYTSTLVLRGRLTIRVVRTGAETTAARIETALHDTVAYERLLVHRSELMSDATTGPTYIVGALAAALQGPLGALKIVSSNYSSTLRLFTPWSMLNHIEIAAGHDILIKDGRSLDTLPRIDTVVFDKTGTLTLGALAVAGIRPLAGCDEHAILRYAAAVEQRQTHPIALAIVEAAADLGMTLPPAIEAAYTLGHGIRARVDGQLVSTGSRRFMHLHGIGLPPEADDEADALHSRIWVAVGHTPLGSIALAPIVRPEARGLIDHLRARGLEVHVLSGDREAPTRALAHSLGIPHVHAETLPEDKARLIEALQSAGHVVCFVGDGINDAIALKKAALSVSLRDAATAAVDSAQVVLTDGTLRRLADLFALGDAFARNQRYNYAATIGTSAVCTVGVFVARLSIFTLNLAFVASAVLGLVINLVPVARARLAHPPPARLQAADG